MRNAEPDRVETGAGRRRAFLALCLVVGAAVFVQGAARLPCISRDGVFFVEYAQKLAYEPLVQLRGQTKQPGYSILLLGLHTLMGRSISERAAVSWEVCGQIIAVLGGISVVGLVYLLTRRLFDATTGLMAALLTAFWPQLVSVSSDVLSDAPHLALYLAGLLLGLRAMVGTAQPTRWGSLVACGAVCGAGYWLRQEALGAAAAVVICLLWPAGGVSLSRRVARAGVVVAAFVIVVAPYSIAVGKVMPNKSIKDLLWGAEETLSTDGADGRRWEEDREIADCGMRNAELKYRKMHDGIREAGPVTWWDAPIKMAGGWSRSGRYVLSTLALVGFFWPRAPRSDRAVRRLVFVAALLQIAAAYARGREYGVVSERYLMIPAGLSIPWAAAGLVALARWVGERWGVRGGKETDGAGSQNIPQPKNQLRSSVGRRSLTVAALIAIAPMAYYDLRPAPRNADWQRYLGQWVKFQSGMESLFTSERRALLLAAPQLSPLSFYSGLERVWPVEEGFQSFISRLPAAQTVWFADHPNLNRLTEVELALLAKCRESVRGLKLSGNWLTTEKGDVVRVYRIHGTHMQKKLPQSAPWEGEGGSGGAMIQE